MFLVVGGNLSLFIMWMLSCVMMAAVSSICLISSNMCWCTFDELMTWFCFSGRISRVNFVVYLLFSIVVDTAVTDGVFSIAFFSFMTVVVVNTLKHN